MGITWGRCSIKLEFGEGSSARWIASAAASSNSNDKSVETLRIKNVTIRRLTTRKTKSPRRMMMSVGVGHSWGNGKDGGDNVRCGREDAIDRISARKFVAGEEGFEFKGKS